MSDFPSANYLCRRLDINDEHFIEIESKRRLLPEQAKKLKKNFESRGSVHHVKSSAFFDQFLDTARFDLLRLGASLRLRYKNNGSKAYLQYKGPGFFWRGVLWRSEFSSHPLKNLQREESRPRMIHFASADVEEIVEKHAEPPMKEAMRRHLGAGILKQIKVSPVISIYKKDKYAVELKSAYLEPSLDQIHAFQINNSGIHALSTFWEYENEIKTEDHSLEAKLRHLDHLLDFDAKIASRFKLPTERLGKYQRCASAYLLKR